MAVSTTDPYTERSQLGKGMVGTSCLHDSKCGKSGLSLAVVPTEHHNQAQKGVERIDAQDAT